MRRQKGPLSWGGFGDVFFCSHHQWEAHFHFWPLLKNHQKIITFSFLSHVSNGKLIFKLAKSTFWLKVSHACWTKNLIFARDIRQKSTFTEKSLLRIKNKNVCGCYGNNNFKFYTLLQLKTYNYVKIRFPCLTCCKKRLHRYFVRPLNFQKKCQKSKISHFSNWFCIVFFCDVVSHYVLHILLDFT